VEPRLKNPMKIPPIPKTRKILSIPKIR